MSDIIVGIDLGTTNSEVAIVQRRQAARLRGGRRSDPAVVRRPVRGRPAARRQGGAQPVGRRPRAHHQIDQAEDGSGRQGPARRSGISPAGNLRHDPAQARKDRASAAARRGRDEGGHHRARLLQRRPAPGHARGRRTGRPRSRAHPQRADRRLAHLRSEAQPSCTASSSTTSAAAPSTSRIVQAQEGVIEVLASHGDTQLGGDDFDELLLQATSSPNSKNSTASTCRTNVIAQARLLRAVEAAKKHLSFHPFARIEEEFIAEKDGQALHLTHGDRPRRIRGADPAALAAHDGLRAARPRRRQRDGGADRQGGAGRRQHAHADRRADAGGTARPAGRTRRSIPTCAWRWGRRSRPR